MRAGWRRRHRVCVIALPRGYTPTGSGAARTLWVDAVQHRGECARFERFVVTGPDPNDCAIWTGAIGADGYGRNRAELHSIRHSTGLH